MSRPRSTWPTGSRWSAWTPRRRSWSATSPTAVGSGNPRASPSGSTSTTSPTRSWARRSPMGSMTLAQHRLGRGRDRPRHRRVRGPDAAALVGAGRPGRLPAGGAAAGLCRRWWFQRLPSAGVEDRAGPACGRDGAGDHRLPPAAGTSKWNRIEHRLCSAISMNWRGRPLVSHEVIVELIGATRTHTGLGVRAELDRGRYPLGVKVRDQDLATVPLVRHEFHGEWNYTIRPAA